MRPLIIAQISDTHIRDPGQLCYGRVDTAAALRICVARVAALDPAPDAVLLTGDLTDSGRDSQYAHLRELLAPLVQPVYLIPGNHDDRQALRAAFADQPWLQSWLPFVQYAIDTYPLRLVALDTLVPGEEGGRLCEERLAWLDSTLSHAPRTPTLLMMHHPPFRTWMAGMDRHGLEGVAGLASVLARHPQIERIVCGHLHRHIESRLGGIPVSVCPSAAHQIALDLAADSPARFIMEPPGFLLHLWREGEGVVTHYAPLGSFPGPFEFDG